MLKLGRALMFAEELKRVFRRPRNIIILGLIALVPILLGVVVRFASHGGPRGGGPAFFAEITQNAVFLPLAALASMETLILPLAATIIAGDSVAGDAANGSLRYLLVRRVPRSRIIHAKMVAALVYTLALGLVIAIVGLVAGAILFPHHQVVTLSGLTISFVHGVLEALLAALVVGASIFSVTMVGIAVSTFTSSSLAATSIAVTVAIASEVLDAIPQLDKIRPILLSNYWSAFINIFRSPILAGPIYKDLLEQLGWMAVFYLLAVFNFSQRDITA